MKLLPMPMQAEALLGQLVQHLIVVARPGIAKRRIPKLVQRAAAVDGRVVAQILPDDLHLERVHLGDVVGHRAGAALVQALQDQVAAPEEALVGVKVEVWKEETGVLALVASKW